MAATSVIFDWDGTLLDTDEALVAPFLALGVPREQITFGHPLEEECERLGLQVADYLAHYDPSVAVPWPGVEQLVAAVQEQASTWAVCSNKRPDSGAVELAALGWQPAGAWWSDAFDGKAKRLGPVLEHLDLDPADVLYVGDTHHDLRCAQEVGVAFVLAGWNPRAVVEGVAPADVLAHPLDVLDRLG